jgi:hypothetical protein
MGLFKINMPMLYGEGDAAFRRLQEEIMRNSDDSSIFCNNGHSDSLMAHSPECFADRGSVTKGRILSAEPCSFTNRGLELFATASTSQITSANVYGWHSVSQNTVYRIDLGCEVLDHTSAAQSQEPVGHDLSMPSGAQYLYLVHSQGGDTYRRLSVAPNDLSQAVLKAEWVDVGEKLFFIVEPRFILRYEEVREIMDLMGW